MRKNNETQQFVIQYGAAYNTFPCAPCSFFRIMILINKSILFILLKFNKLKLQTFYIFKKNKKLNIGKCYILRPISFKKETIYTHVLSLVSK